MSSTRRVPAPDVSTEVQEKGLAEEPVILEPEPSEGNFVAILQLFWQHRRFLARVGAVALLASALIAFLIPSSYDSATRLMPPDGHSGALGMLAAMTGAGGPGAGAGGLGNLGGLGALAGDLLGVKSSGALFMGIINSETVQDSVIEQFNLKRVYWDSKIEDARKDLARHTEISEERKSGIITITVTDRDPKRAAAMAQAYVAQLDGVVARVSTSAARRERLFLESRLKEVKQDLDASAHKFSDFASKNTALDIPAQGKAMVEAAATLQGYLIAAEAELRGLQQIYSDNNFRIRATQARVQELRNKLNELGTGSASGDTGEAPLYPAIRKLPLLGVTYFDLYRETRIQEAVYQFLTQQYEVAKVQEAKEIPSVKVLDKGLVPTKKSFPPRTLITLLGTLLGLTTAMAWIVGKTRWDVMDVGDPRKVFAAEVFTTLSAHMPRLSRNGARPESNGRRPWSWTGKHEEVHEEAREDEDHGAR